MNSMMSSLRLLSPVPVSLTSFPVSPAPLIRLVFTAEDFFSVVFKVDLYSFC